MKLLISQKYAIKFIKMVGLTEPLTPSAGGRSSDAQEPVYGGVVQQTGSSSQLRPSNYPLPAQAAGPRVDV